MGTGLGGQISFEQNCTTCHGYGSTVDRAPRPDALMQMPPEAIYESLTNGTMREQAKDLSVAQKRNLAEFLGGRPMGSADAGDSKNMTNPCQTNASIREPLTPAWNGWGADLSNSRFQPAAAAGLTADQVPRLTVKWAFGFPNGAEAFGQPTVAAGRVFVGSDNGYVYSLDAATGCVYWSFRAQAGVRTAIAIGRVKSGSATHAAYFGDLRSNAYAVDAATGRALWTTKVDVHALGKITGAPTLHDGRLYVPVSSSEEVTAANPRYPCCSFRGSVVALDANTGRQIWKTYLVPEPKPTIRNAAGTQLWGPAGAAVWVAPTVDVKRRVLYVGTGDAFTEPAPPTTDAIVALDLTTGTTAWVYQAVSDDAWIAGCGPNNTLENCPKKLGPDADFGASVILQTLPDGRQAVIGAHKGGGVLAVDPDRAGALIWTRNLAEKPPGPSGLIMFGGASDQDAVYFGLTTGGVAAIRAATGEVKWLTTLTPAASQPTRRGQSAAVTAIPGVVFSGGWDGVLRALSADDGRVIWQYDTVREFMTVNGVAAKGGSMGAPGATVADGMLFVGSGYTGVGNGLPGNVLLAFTPD